MTESGYTARTSYQGGEASLRKVVDKLAVEGCSISYRSRSDFENHSFVLNTSMVRVNYFWGMVNLAAASQDVTVQEQGMLGTKYFDVKISSSPGKLLGKYGTKTFISENEDLRELLRKTLAMPRERCSASLMNRWLTEWRKP